MAPRHRAAGCKNTESDQNKPSQPLPRNESEADLHELEEKALDMLR
jgi:hypothetical protein